MMTLRYRICFAFAAVLNILPELLVILIAGTIAWMALWGYVAYVTEHCK